MAITSGSTSGTSAGDQNGIWIDVDISIDPITNKLTCSGSLSYLSNAVYPLSGTYAIPASDPVLTTYVSLQVSSTGVLQFMTSTSAMPTLQVGNVLIVYNNSYLPNAASVQAFSSEALPDL